MVKATVPGETNLADVRSFKKLAKIHIGKTYGELIRTIFDLEVAAAKSAENCKKACDDCDLVMKLTGAYFDIRLQTAADILDSLGRARKSMMTVFPAMSAW